MAKFAIACPACGRYAEAKTGFFAKKKIECACGNVIDVRTDRLASRQCPHCGNQVVFDQTKGASAACPVCHAPINTQAEQQRMETFSCRQCGVRLSTVRSAVKYVCPVCDFENDVQERLVAERIRRDGLASIIKYEGKASRAAKAFPSAVRRGSGAAEGLAKRPGGAKATIPLGLSVGLWPAADVSAFGD